MPLITISQDYGSHGYYVAQKVAQELQLELYDDETLREAAVKLGVKTENLNALKEHVPGFFDRLMSVKPDIYLDVLKGVVYHMSSKNKGVIVGHGSHEMQSPGIENTCKAHPEWCRRDEHYNRGYGTG